MGMRGKDNMGRHGLKQWCKMCAHWPYSGSHEDKTASVTQDRQGWDTGAEARRVLCAPAPVNPITTLTSRPESPERLPITP